MAVIVEVQLLLVSALRRLWLYEEAYGFTMLRLYSHIFAGWIGLAFRLFAADLAVVWRGRRWLAGSTLVAVAPAERAGAVQAAMAQTWEGMGVITETFRVAKPVSGYEVA